MHNENDNLYTYRSINIILALPVRKKNIVLKEFINKYLKKRRFKLSFCLFTVKREVDKLY